MPKALLPRRRVPRLISSVTVAPEAVPVSVLIPARNERPNIRAALDSVRWANEVWVVDSHSTDGTGEIARACGAQVTQFDYSGRGPKKKNWALENLPLNNEWILILDADERVTAELAQEIAEVVPSGEADGYFLDREYIFLGRSLKSFRPNWNLRLFKHRLGRYEQLATNVRHTGDNEVHEHVVLNGRAAYLRAPLLHDDRRPLRAWVENHNRYSEWEAEVYSQLLREPMNLTKILSTDSFWRRRILKRVWVRLPFRPFARFALFYFFRRGFLDGRQGLWYAILMGYYEFLISLKSRELASSTNRQDAAADGLPDRALTEAPHA
jgi:glycosyltransferase involved in cell wall biosynthesis